MEAAFDWSEYLIVIGFALAWGGGFWLGRYTQFLPRLRK